MNVNSGRRPTINRSTGSKFESSIITKGADRLGWVIVLSRNHSFENSFDQNLRLFVGLRLSHIYEYSVRR